ncbi:hypothetical protein ACFWOX_40750 [Streptomyces sp. NPDC058467]|uniref:hypothetical protein n=1 Tax=Streptomyces sp. NPDC058467 TaxID=3346513 RepID=UPI0036487F43
MASSYDFPHMLTAAQSKLDQVPADLQALFETLPWSVEPTDGWETHENAWRPASRPASPGWDPQDATEVARLRAREVELARLVVGHQFWGELSPADLPAARDALKHHRERKTADTVS